MFIYVLVSIAIIIGVIVAILLSVLLLRISNISKPTDESILKTDLVELNRSLNNMQNHFGDKLDKNNTAMQMSVQKQLSQSSRLISEVSSRLAKLDETNKHVGDVASDLKTLQNVLQNPKQRGVFGEFYLESVLDNVLSPKQYGIQYRFKNGDAVDAVVFLEKGKVLPIDSKFSLENYNRMVAADGKVDKQEYLAKVKADLKKRIDETNKYIRPDEGTMDFAFMFIPSEALYYDLLIGEVGTGASARDLMEYAFNDKRVIIVSPTSFMAYLQTVLQGLRSLQIEDQAKEIQKRVGQLSRHVSVYDQLLGKLGNSLSSTVTYYNNAHKELKKVDKDIVKISDKAANVDPITIDKPDNE